MHLFISPHPDDAALSCGGLIHQLAQTGQAVCILTTMGGDPPHPPPDTPRIRELHARWQAGAQPAALRRAEDAAAAAVLGASIRFAPLPDCIYRCDPAGTPLYPTGQYLFAEVRAGLDPAQPVTPVLAALGADLARIQRVYLPLAVGNHVDHQIARGWAAPLRAHLPPSAELWFYDDYPYSAQPNARSSALAAWPSAQRDIQMVLSPTDVRAKIESIRCYQSQLSTFWANWDVMAAQLTNFMTADGTRPPVELYWTGENLGDDRPT